MPDQSIGTRLWRLIEVNWRELSTAWKAVVIAGAAIVLICCCGIIGSLGGDPGTGPPVDSTSEAETSPVNAPDRPTAGWREPTQPPTTQFPSPSPSPTPSPSPSSPPPPPTTEDDDVYYENCDAARADGAAPLYEGDAGYAPHLDADGDGVACEPYAGNDDDDGGNGGGNGDSDAYYENCDAARADGAAPLFEGDPGYDDHLDRDGDGVACEN
ncbi:excalibur calcium-binding domain-containing protein [Glycomyces niveus]|uniref:Excalibur calcium-binding domain-containing protein n=1 Tax=Glycomyces niveus TaxID=2820287 RepID=A0ABS3U7F2_9ACTN|nr:excalibur calcium-binding domain-containing protein [Glycomyces sp. NEAU-S30]MBO3734709.1 excalibur calcium-binding domain-containing protein [Glycomyces sp. NEAU-S30]